MRLEQSWRNAIAKLSEKYPQAKDALEDKLESVGNIMTGGDYAVIRAAESFEDSTKLGEEQAREMGLGEADLLVGVTATGETTSILGTAMQALRDGASVYMLICADHKPLIDKMARARIVYTNPKCSVMFLPCGPMALTGSTRMQSSSFEQLAGCVALEGALHDILLSCGIADGFIGYGWYGAQFVDMTRQLMEDQAVKVLAEASYREEAVYKNKGLITLFADEFLLDVLTDTTERSPTFMTPPFCSADMTQSELSWAFVKNPTCETEEAWVNCFLREPNCISWTRDKYAQLGLTEKQIEKIPDISLNALKKFMIGNEPMPERERAADSHALWVDAKSAPDTFVETAKRYATSGSLTIADAGVTLPETGMDMFEHLCIKLMLNTLSTGVMARMGRVDGNWMTSLAMSNKKLIDRSARIVSDVCGVAYEVALEEVYYSRALAEAEGVSRSAAQDAIRRLGIK
jgi:N-acetylmuramic acid 6-phosphate etherase